MMKVEIGKTYVLKNEVVVKILERNGTAEVVYIPEEVEGNDPYFKVGSRVCFLIDKNENWTGGMFGKDYDVDEEVMHKDDIKKSFENKGDVEDFLKFLMKGVQQMMMEYETEKEVVEKEEYVENEKIDLDKYHYEVEVVEGDAGSDNEGEKLFKVSVVEDEDGTVYDVSFAEHIHDAVANLDKDVVGIFPEWFGDEISIGRITAFVIEKSDTHAVAIGRAGHKYMLCTIDGCDCEGIQVIPKSE